MLGHILLGAVMLDSKQRNADKQECQDTDGFFACSRANPGTVSGLAYQCLPMACLCESCRPVFWEIIWSLASHVVSWKDKYEEDVAGFSKWDQFVSHHICISFLIQRKLRELDFLSFQLIHSQEHRVGYCDNKAEIGRTSVKLPPSPTALYLRAGQLYEIPMHLLCGKFKKVAGPTIFWGYRSICIPPPVKPNLSVENALLRRFCRLHGEFPCPVKWKIWPCIASVARADAVTGLRQEQHFGEKLQDTWDERREAVMQTAVLLITGNVNKKGMYCQTTHEQQESSGYVSKILRMDSQHCTSLW